MLISFFIKEMIKCVLEEKYRYLYWKILQYLKGILILPQYFPTFSIDIAEHFRYWYYFWVSAKTLVVTARGRQRIWCNLLFRSRIVVLNLFLDVTTLPWWKSEYTSFSKFSSLVDLSLLRWAIEQYRPIQAFVNLRSWCGDT